VEGTPHGAARLALSSASAYAFAQEPASLAARAASGDAVAKRSAYKARQSVESLRAAKLR
jgi:hypothetical protein